MKEQHYAPITVDINDLMDMTGLSKNTCIKLAKDADAVIHLGIRRTLYNVQKIQHFLNCRTGEEAAFYDDGVRKTPVSAVAKRTKKSSVDSDQEG